MFAVNMNYMSRDPDVPHRCADVLQLRCFLPHYTCFMLVYFRWIAVCTYYYYYFFKTKTRLEWLRVDIVFSHLQSCVAE